MRSTFSAGLLRMAAALIAGATPFKLSGQALPQTDTVLARLTAEAVAANPSLGVSRAEALAALRRIRPAGALPDPMLSVGVMDLTLPRFAFRESDFTEVDVELSQEFPWPGTLGARTQAARAEARGRAADVAVRRRDVVVRTAELYYRLRYVVTARVALVRQRSLLAAAVDIATTRYATASAPQSDPL
ncbi:MAG: TolC family protein, partial [Gemmatimonadales bacterium]